MISIFSFEGWNKPVDEKELYERARNISPKFESDLKLHKFTTGFVGPMVGFTFGGISETQFDWLENLLPIFGDTGIFYFIVTGIIGAVIFFYLLRFLSNFKALKKLQYEEQKLIKSN